MTISRNFGRQQNANMKKANNPKKKRNRNRRRNRQRNRGGQIPQQMPFTARTGNSIGAKQITSKIVPFREELGPISGSSAFATTAYSLNPGQSATFPWLALEAKQWEKYRFKSLKFLYTPQVTEYSTNGVGTLVLGFDANASDAPPNDLTHALNCQPRVFDLPCKELELNIPQKAMNLLTDGYFVRPGNLPGQSDIKTYDCGNLNISTMSNVNANQIGILAVEYTVEFLIPILEPTVGPPMNNSVSFFASGGTGETAATGVETQSLLASTLANGCNAVNTAGSIVLPQGNYLLDVYWEFYVNATDLDEVIGDIKKNGTSLFKTNLEPNAGNYAGILGDQFYNVKASEFVTSNGTDAFTFFYEGTYSGGAMLVDVRVRFVSI